MAMRWKRFVDEGDSVCWGKRGSGEGIAVGVEMGSSGVVESIGILMLYYRAVL